MSYKIEQIYPTGTAVHIHPYMYLVFVANSKYYVRDYNGNIKYSDINAANAIEWALNNLTSGRTWKERIILNGDFTIPSPVDLQSYCVLQIDGRLRLKDAANCQIFYADSKEYIDIIGGELDGNKANQTSAVEIAYFLNCTNINIEKCRVHDSSQYGIQIYATTADKGYAIVKNNEFYNNSELDIFIVGYSDAVRIKHAYISGNYVHDSIKIGARYSDFIKIMNNKVLNCSAGITVRFGSHIAITHNIVDTSSTSGIQWTGGLGIAEENIRVSHNRCTNCTEYGIYLTNVGDGKDLTIDHNISKNNASGSINCSSAGTNCNIVHNLVDGPITGPGWTIRYNEGYVTEKTGTSTFSGDGTKVFNITSHGLASNPSDRTKIKCYATPQSTDAENASPVSAYPADIDADGYYEGLRIVFATAPATGTNNVVVSWYAELTS